MQSVTAPPSACSDRRTGSRRGAHRAPRGPQSDRARASCAAALVVVSSLGMQLSATTAHGLFDRLGPPAVSALRFVLAAVLLLLLTRPRLRGYSAGELRSILAFGAVLAVMNVCLYAALERLPLGLVVTIDFLGPFAVAVAGLRRARALIWPVLGLVGIALIAGTGGRVDVVGVVLALGSAAGYGMYTILAGRMGGAGRGLGPVALSVAVAAVLLLPVSLPAVPALTWPDLTVLGVSGVLGVAIAFSADVTAVSLIGAPAVAVLFALDPLVAGLVGLGLLGQVLLLPTAAGIVLVAVAGAGTIWNAARGGAPRVVAAGGSQLVEAGTGGRPADADQRLRTAA